MYVTWIKRKMEGKKNIRVSVTRHHILLAGLYEGQNMKKKLQGWNLCVCFIWLSSDLVQSTGAI